MTCQDAWLTVPRFRPATLNDHFANFKALERWANTEGCVADYDYARYQLTLPTFRPQSEEQHFANWRAVERWANDPDRLAACCGTPGPTPFPTPIPDTWSTLTQWPIATIPHMGAVAGGLLYGQTSANNNYAYSYLPLTDTWSSVASTDSVLACLQYGVSVSFQDTWYAIAGQDAWINAGSPANSHSGRLYVYDAGADTWSIVGLNPAWQGYQTNLNYHFACANSTNIWVGAGQIAKGTYDAGNVYNRTLWSWNPGDGWVQRHIMPFWLEYGVAAAWKEEAIYVFGGGSSTVLSDAYATVLRYDIASDTWSMPCSLPFANTKPVAVTLGDYIVVFGGLYDTGRHTWIYDPVSNQWAETTAIPAAKNLGNSSIAAGVIDNAIYVCGGNSRALYKLEAS